MLEQDVLKSKGQLDPRVIAELERQLAVGSERRLKLVANLPYSVATPVIANLLSSPTVPRTMTVTIQKELADRIIARPETKDYGALSVWVQSQCRVELVRILPPSVFWPRPKVTSAILHLEFDPELRGRIGDLAFFHDFVRSLFFHRRKLLRRVLQSGFKGRLDKQAIDQLLDESGMAADCRAEQLDVETILRLSEMFRSNLLETP